MVQQNREFKLEARYFNRPRITAMLREATGNNIITFLSAPFYHGKTTAAAALAKETQCRWHSFCDGLFDEEMFLDLRDQPQTLLILDDFDRLSGPEQTKLADYLLQAKQHCLILSRSNPSMKLRSSRLCCCIGNHEMDFDNDELIAYGKKYFPKLPEAQLEKMAKLSDGWVPAFEIGLYIMQRGSARSQEEFLSQCYAEIWHIFDEKVMESMTMLEREFLLAIGCFETISVEMAQLVTGLADCQAIFDDLDTKCSYYVEKGSGLYLLHAQVHMYLTDRRKALLSPEEQVRIYRSAGRYYYRRGQMSEALFCYEQAGDYQTILPILEEISEQSPENSQLWQLRRRFEILPESLIQKSAQLCFAKAMLGVMSFHPAETRRWCDEIKRLANDASLGNEQQRKAQGLLCYMEFVLQWGKPEQSVISLNATANTLKKTGLIMPKITLTANRPSVISGSVDLSCCAGESEALTVGLAQAIELLCAKYGAGAMELLQSEILYQKDELAQALLGTVSALAQIEQSGNAELLFAAAFTQIAVMMVSGQAGGVAPMLDNLGRKLEHQGRKHLMPNYKAVRAWFALYDKACWDVNRWLAEDAPDENGDFCTLDSFAYFVKLRVYLANEQYLSFLALEKRMRQFCNAYGRVTDMIELDALSAISHWQNGQQEEAMECMKKALQSAQQYGFVRIVANMGKPIYHILQLYAQQKPDVDASYLASVIEAAKRMAIRFPDYLKPKRMNGPKLTESEIDVIQLMAQEYTNAGICEFLNITNNTVKFHSKNIFAKFGVNNRTQAVKAARELNIIKE